MHLLAFRANADPSLLALQGPPGTGKTTSVLCLARALLGSSYREGVLELNASDDRCSPLPYHLPNQYGNEMHSAVTDSRMLRWRFTPRVVGGNDFHLLVTHIHVRVHMNGMCMDETGPGGIGTWSRTSDILSVWLQGY